MIFNEFEIILNDSILCFSSSVVAKPSPHAYKITGIAETDKGYGNKNDVLEENLY